MRVASVRAVPAADYAKIVAKDDPLIAAAIGLSSSPSGAVQEFPPANVDASGTETKKHSFAAIAESAKVWAELKALDITREDEGITAVNDKMAIGGLLSLAGDTGAAVLDSMARGGAAPASEKNLLRRSLSVAEILWLPTHLPLATADSAFPSAGGAGEVVGATLKADSFAGPLVQVLPVAALSYLALPAPSIGRAVAACARVVSLASAVADASSGEQQGNIHKAFSQRAPASTSTNESFTLIASAPSVDDIRIAVTLSCPRVCGLQRFRGPFRYRAC